MRACILVLIGMACSTIGGAEQPPSQPEPPPSSQPQPESQPRAPAQPHAGDMRSDIAGALAKPSEIKPNAARDLPPDFIVLHALLTAASKLNFRTKGRGHDYLHRAIGFSNKGALALMAYNRKFEKLKPPEDDASLHETLCPRVEEFTSTDEIARVAAARDDAEWGRWGGFVAGAYAVLEEADIDRMRRFLEPRSKPASAFQRVNWNEALAGRDAKEFLIRLCDPERKVCRGRFNRNYEIEPGENCGSAQRSHAVVPERQVVCSDHPEDRRVGLIPPCRDTLRQ